MTIRTLILASPFFLASAMAIGQDELPSFADVDTNADGVLSITEAQDVLPVIIRDLNSDGIVNRNEVAAVMPEVGFEADDVTEVGASDYELIVEYLAERRPAVERPTEVR